MLDYFKKVGTLLYVYLLNFHNRMKIMMSIVPRNCYLISPERYVLTTVINPYKNEISTMTETSASGKVVLGIVCPM